MLKGKPVCERKRHYTVFNKFITNKNHECFKTYCRNRNQNKEVNHFCYMQPLKNELPRSDDVLFVFYDFETTQNTKFSDVTEHVPILVCLPRFCMACDMQKDIDKDCERCGKRRHSFY
jgi:hypothetical protein